MLIEKEWGKPIVCNVGVTIAKEIDLADPEENLGAQTLREAAEKTGDVVGDGTTTATLLAHAILADGVRNIAAGASAVDLKRGLDRGLRAAVAEIKALSRPVQSRKERSRVATASAHNDPSIGDLVAEAMVPGGGLALLQSIEAVEREAVACEGDERTGVLILRWALEVPARQIAANSEVDGGVGGHRPPADRGDRDQAAGAEA